MPSHSHVSPKVTEVVDVPPPPPNITVLPRWLS